MLLEGCARHKVLRSWGLRTCGCGSRWTLWPRFGIGMAAARSIAASNDQPGWCLSSINDTEGHAVIVQMFRNALEKWEKPLSEAS
jgi:hypothetical protein